MPGKDIPTLDGLFDGSKQGTSPDTDDDVQVAGRGVHHTGSSLNIQVDDIETARMLFIAVIVDDSGSISYANNTSLVVDGFNEMFIDGLRGSKAEESIYLVVIALNGGKIYEGYITGDPKLTRANYQPRGMTPLYARTIEALTDVDAKIEEFEDNGVEAQAFMFIVSDGGDTDPRGHSAKEVESKVHDMGESLMVLALGMDDKGCSTGGDSTDFQAVFQSMGIPEHCVLVAEWDADSDPDKKAFQSSVRHAFGVASKSAARASQSGDSFSQAADDGFTD